MRLWPSAVVVALALAGGCAAAESLDDLERAVRAGVAARDRLAGERQTRGVEASQLADEIAELKRRGHQPRADRELERRLQAFDRVALALDEFDRKLKAQERNLAQARSRFMAQADSELAALAKQRPSAGAALVAARIEAVEAMRRRVRAAVGEGRGVRPALEIALVPEDGLSEVQSKIALLQSERQRLATAVTMLERESAVVETRLTLKRQLARELDAATREGGVALTLVQREMDDLLEAVKELEQQRDALARDRDRLPGELGQLDSRIEVLSRRTRELAPASGAGGSP